jgi:hypothetical protein
MSSQTPNLPAVIPPNDGLPQPANVSGPMALLHSVGPRYLSNIPKDDPALRPLIFKATGEADSDFVTENGKVWETAYYFAHPVQMTANDGEIVPALRVVLLQPDGRSIATVSPHIARSMGMILDTFGPGPWSPPLRLIPTVKKARGAGTFFTLSVDFSPTPKPSKGK